MNITITITPTPEQLGQILSLLTGKTAAPITVEAVPASPGPAEVIDERTAEVREIVAEQKAKRGRPAKAKAEPQPEPAPQPEPVPAPQPEPAPAPQPEPAPGLTIEDLKRALMDRVKAYGYDSAVAILKSYGAARLQDVPAAKWVKVHSALLEGL
jgi:hypothetical protein